MTGRREIPAPRPVKRAVSSRTAVEMRMCAAIAAVVLAFLVVPVVARAQTEKTAEEKKAFSEETDALEKQFDFLESELAGDMAAEEGGGDGAEIGNGDEPTGWHGITTWKGTIRETFSYEANIPKSQGHLRMNESVNGSVTLKADDIIGEDRILFWNVSGESFLVHVDRSDHSLYEDGYKILTEATASTTTVDGDARLAIDLDEGTYNIHYDAGTVMGEYYYLNTLPGQEAEERWTDTIGGAAGIILLGGTFEDIPLPSSVGPLTGSRDIPAVPGGGTATRTFTWNLRPAGKDQPNLRILRPQTDEKLVYENGKLVIPAEASVEPAEYEKDVVWEIDNIQGSNKTISPARGSKVTMTFNKLPQDNDQFGEKKITARVKGAEDHVTIRVFFSKDDHDNPGGKDPNWFYYWRQGVVGGLEGFQYKPGGSYFDPATGELVVSDDAAGSAGGGSVPLAGGKTGCTMGAHSIDLVDTEGVDTVARVVAHELKHEELFQGTVNKKTGKASRMKDRDSDGVPDRMESSSPYCLDPMSDNTHNLPADHGTGDTETLAISAEAASQGRANHNLDWASPGSQY